ncbi:hypothetical protein [Streptomyces sp. NPDC002287]
MAGAGVAGALFVLPMEDGTEALRQAFGAQLEAVALWWERPPPDGPGFVKVAPAQPVNSRHDVECFLEESGIREAEADVPLVLYVTGHGLTSAAAKHFAVLRDTDTGRLLGTGLRTTEIVVAALDSHARDVVVIVNMCESADLAGELLELTRDLSEARREEGTTLNVLTTAAPKTRVLGGEFALVLRWAHEWLRTAGGITRPYLTMAEFSRALRRAAQAVGAELGRSLSVDCRPVLTGDLHAPTPSLPNPGHRPDPAVVEASRQEVAATFEDLAYWLEKASGRTGADDTGWYFSGRRQLNASVVSFLNGPAGVLVVTGITASGKSAILGRAVTLSDARFRRSALFAAAVGHCPPETVPQEGAVTVAVTARNREALGLLKAIAQKLGVAPDPSGRDPLSRWQLGLRKFLGAAGDVVTIVVDSLDEAADPATVLQQVLVPLVSPLPAEAGPGAVAPAVRRGVRLLLAVRSSDPARDEVDGQGERDGRGLDLLGRLRAAFPGADVLRTDGHGMGADVEAYVRALLHGEPGWAGQDLTAVSETVAGAAGRSFLDARVAAGQLRAEGPGLLADARWLERLGEGTTGLLEADLVASAEDGLAAREALALLRAAAFAQGRGIAWGEVWPAVASALVGGDIEDADEKILTLLGGRLAGYLTHDVEDDQRVYRPAHERLAAVLRAWPAAGAAPGGGMDMTGGQDGPADGTAGADAAADGAHGDPYAHKDEAGADAAVHARIARALAELAAPRTARAAAGTAPHPYVRRYLARHARLGGVLDDAHVPAEVLPWLTGSPVRGLLGPGRGQEGRLWLEAWAAVEPYLHQVDDHPSRLASLHLAYTALRFPGLARPPMPVEEAAPAQAAPSDVSPLTVLWSQWAPAVNVLATLGATVRSLAAVAAPDGRPALAAGDENGAIELFDAVEGTALRERIHAHEGEVRHLLLAPRPAQSALLVSGSTDGTVRLWDPSSGRLVDQVHRPGGIWIADVCAYRDSEHELAVLSVNGNGEVVWWNERMGPQHLLTLPGDVPRTTTVALAAVEDPAGRPLLAVADGTTLAFRDAGGGGEVARFELPGRVRVLTATTRPGTVAAGHADGSVTLWGADGMRSALTGGGTGPVSTLAALTLDGRHLLAAGSGNDILLWDTDTDTPAPAGILGGHTAAVTALSPAAVFPDAAVLASASTDGTLRLWNPEALRKALDSPHTAALPVPVPTGGALLAREPGDARGPSWFALSGGHPHIDVRDMDTGDAVARIDTGPGPGPGTATGRPPTALAWARRAQGRVLVAADGEDHAIRLWDAATLCVLPDVLDGHLLPVRSLAAWTTAEGRHLLLSGGDDMTVRLWDLDHPGPLRAWSGHGMRVWAVAAASGGPGRDWLASAGSDGTVRFWDTEHGQLGGPLRCDQGLLHAVALNPRPLGGLPPHLASAGDTGTVRLWDLSARRPLGEPLTGHTAAVHAVALWNTEGHGSLVAAGAADGTIRVWEAATGVCRLFLATGSPVRSLAAHPAAGAGRVVLSFTGPAGAAAVEIDLARCWRVGD